MLRIKGTKGPHCTIWCKGAVGMQQQMIKREEPCCRKLTVDLEPLLSIYNRKIRFKEREISTLILHSRLLLPSGQILITHAKCRVTCLHSSLNSWYMYLFLASKYKTYKENLSTCLFFFLRISLFFTRLLKDFGLHMLFNCDVEYMNALMVYTN